MQNINDFFKKYLAQNQFTTSYRQLINQALADPDVQAFLKLHQDELHEETIEKSAAAIYEFVTIKQGRSDEETISAAGYEPVLQMNNGDIEVGYRPTAKLVDQRQAAAQADRIKVVNLPKDLADVTFDDYSQKFAGRMTAFEAAIDLTTQLIGRETSETYVKGVYLSGPFGLGKTFLLGAMANNLAKNGITSTLVHFPTFAVQMKQAINDHKVWQRLQNLEETPVLMIDDIGADALSPWIRDEVLSVILQYRMQERLTTCFTSNLSMSELQAYLSQTNQGVDEIKSARIMERIHFLATEYQMTGPNLRQENLTQE